MTGLFCSNTYNVSAEEPGDVIRISQEDHQLDISDRIEFFVDPGGLETIDTVQQREFRAHRDGNLSFGFTKDVIWLRFTVVPDYSKARDWIVEIGHPLLDEVRLFSQEEPDAWTAFIAGDAVDESLRDLKLRTVAFSVVLPAQETKTYYLRVKSDSSILLPISITENSRYFSRSATTETGLGLFFGGLIVMAIFNLVLFASIRDPNYLLYSAAVIATTLFQSTLSGHGFQYLWPNHAAWTNVISLYALIGAISLGLWFSLQFLETRKNVPTWHWVMVGLIGLSFLLAPIHMIFGYSRAISLGAVLSVISGVVALYAGIWCLRKNVYSAKFYVLARTGFCIGSILTAGRQLGVFPDLFITEHGMRIGAFLESILLAFALSDRYNQLRAEKEAAEKQTADELRQLDKLKDEIMANTSHELRTPLQGIIGVSESMLDGAAGRLSSSAKHNLSMIVSSGKRLAGLVDDILDFSRLKTRDLRLDLKAVDLNVASDVVVTLFQPLVSNRPVELLNNIPDELPFVMADETRLQQILSNVIGNAIKFTDEGEVTITAYERGGEIIVEVSDTGIGIAEEDQDRIFESFEQAEGSAVRQRGGTGLGLSVTKQLVELQGGEVSVSSKPNEGSTFTFTLPQATEESLQDANSRKGSILPEGDRGANDNKPEVFDSGKLVLTKGSGARVLIVDDEPVNQQVLANHLSLADYSVSQAMDGAEALRMLDSGERFDLILLDVMMPHMSGYEVCEKIRQTHLANQLPVIMVTAKTQNDDLVTGLSVGANDYIGKPVSKQELLARIKTHLNLLNINSAYGNFVPHEFLRHLGKDSIIDVQLGDNVELELAIVWSDIRSFTTLFEGMTPIESFNFINGYFGRMGPVIREHDGFVNSFIGDAIMALFVKGVDSAIAAAIASSYRLDAYNAERKTKGRKPIDAGFAVHSGTARMGVVGELERRQSEVFSDAVNLTSRMEGLTKLYGSRVIVSADALERASADLYSVRRLDRVQVKGRFAEIELFEVLDCLSDRETKERTRDMFEAAVNFKLSGKYSDASANFSDVLKLDPDDAAARYHLSQIEEILQATPKAGE
ncbi:MAG: 7TM diverse intracellular signaling domain-containing protein [Pseudomonadota bacterium]